MAKIYIGNYEAADKGLLDALRRLNDSYHVFVEFQIPNPRGQRQVDFLVIRLFYFAFAIHRLRRIVFRNSLCFLLVVSVIIISFHDCFYMSTENVVPHPYESNSMYWLTF